jgi:outer membrane protein assembly factor BamD (BamD/ComL family)
VRAQAELNAWESAQALLAAKSYDAFTTASLEFVREFPGTERAQLMSFWAACVPMWQGKPADSAPKLNALLTGELLDSIRESVLVELAKCQQAIADIDGYTTTAQAYREKFPKGSNLETIAFLEAQTLIATQSYSEAADKLQRFIEDWPESPNIRAASFARVQALHDARRSQDVDAACQAYLSRYPDSVEAINVKYIKMLVPLTLQRPNWDEAIDRCNLFRLRTQRVILPLTRS